MYICLKYRSCNFSFFIEDKKISNTFYKVNTERTYKFDVTTEDAVSASNG